ncbi:MAG TPA: DNA primase [Syntrophaceae bacterium]|nr:DNA primase [Syntrophaceae bacterium]
MLKGHIAPEKIEEVKRRADIVDLVSEYVTLKKGGRNFLGLCPFHKEKTPSFTVSREKQIFYCFGCGEGGNVLTFLMKMNNMSFPEAVRFLAGKTGVVIPERIFTREEKESSRTREEISRINRMAAKYFSENLFSKVGNGARAYLGKRGIHDEVIKEYSLGYATEGWRNLKEYFEKSKISLKLLERAGLIIPKTNGGGSYYDRFRGRLMFPIEDVSGNVIAFGGRILGEGEPKYLNTPESPVFIKGRNLYGLNRTKEDIRRKGYAILVEGYFDLITLWGAGWRNVVATLGTALTKDHIDLIRRYTNEVIVLFDPDLAGKKALARSIELFLSGNVRAKAVVLPDGYDPDLYVRTNGSESLKEIIGRAQSMIDYYIENLIGKVSTVEEKRDALREAVSFIINIDNKSERDLFIRRVSEKLGINQELLTKEVNRTVKASTVNPGAVSTEPDMDIDTVELSLIHIMLEYPHKIPEIVQKNILNCFLSANLKSLAKRLTDSFEKEGSESFDAPLFVQTIENDGIRQKLLKKMINENPYDEGIVERIIMDAMKQVKRKWYKEKGRILTREIKKADESGDNELSNRLLAEKERLLREEKTLH